MPALERSGVAVLVGEPRQTPAAGAGGAAPRAAANAVVPPHALAAALGRDTVVLGAVGGSGGVHPPRISPRMLAQQVDKAVPLSGAGGGLDPSGRDHAALVLWLLGYPDQALERLREVLTAVQKRPHPFSLAVALLFAAVLHQLRREAILA
ncbi:MAG: hypothetical protein M3361_14015 [Candidatus Tectomicrobia bacterium]|nr:hypothetical protein [Candidatus Tectomicrobia bacterium]